MDIRRGLQRQSLDDTLPEPGNRKERRDAQKAFRRRAKEWERKRKRRKVQEAAGQCILGGMLGLMILWMAWMLFLADDGSGAVMQMPEQKWYVDGCSGYCYTSEEDFLGYLRDKAAWEADKAKFWDSIREAQGGGRQ